MSGKYYWLTFYHDVEIYIQGCNVYLSSKTVCHKSYRELQFLLVPTDWWKDLLIDFVTGLLLSTDWEGDSYDLVLVIVDCLTKMVY